MHRYDVLVAVAVLAASVILSSAMPSFAGDLPEVDSKQLTRTSDLVMPKLSQKAMKRTPGTVVLRLTIDERGTVTQVRAVSGDAELAKAAVDAVKQWRYAPYLQDGKPTAVTTTVNFEFGMIKGRLRHSVEPVYPPEAKTKRRVPHVRERRELTWDKSPQGTDENSPALQRRVGRGEAAACHRPISSPATPSSPPRRVMTQTNQSPVARRWRTAGD